MLGLWIFSADSCEDFKEDQYKMVSMWGNCLKISFIIIWCEATGKMWPPILYVSYMHSFELEKCKKRAKKCPIAHGLKASTLFLHIKNHWQQSLVMGPTCTLRCWVRYNFPFLNWRDHTLKTICTQYHNTGGKIGLIDGKEGFCVAVEDNTNI